MTDQLTHLDPDGNPSMVNVGEKKITLRSATAQSIIAVNDSILAQLNDGDILTKKGAVFQTAILAGIMGAKKTSDLIPLCHPLGLDNCKVVITVNEAREIVVNCTASLSAKTGVEMEALTGATVAALTIYDMCKAMSHDIVIKETRLLRKTGGKKDFNYHEK